MERLETGLSKMGASTSAQYLQRVRRLNGDFTKSGSLQNNKRHLR